MWVGGFGRVGDSKEGLRPALLSSLQWYTSTETSLQHIVFGGILGADGVFCGLQEMGPFLFCTI